jgi:hypothetical protein
MGLSASPVLPRTFRLERTLKFAGFGFVVFLMLIPVVIAARAGVYDSFIDSALTGWGMWGAFAIYLWTHPSRKELAVTAGVALALRVAYDLAIGERGYPGSLVLGMGAFLALASLPALIVRSLDPASEARTLCRRSLVVMALLSYIGVCLTFYVSFARLMLPNKLDYFLYNFDGSLGFQPSFAAGRLVQSVRPLFWLIACVYDSLGFWFGLVYAFHSGMKRPSRISVLKLYITNAFVALPLYFLFPAMGPKFAFHSFPALPGAVVTSAAAALSGVPNAMPSLHLGGALLLCWLSKPWKWLYRTTAVFAALTAVATIAVGEHYLVDLVVAVPYALTVFAFSADVPERRVPLIVGPVLVFSWLAYLRTGWYSTPISWALVLATLAITFALQRRLPVWSEPIKA